MESIGGILLAVVYLTIGIVIAVFWCFQLRYVLSRYFWKRATGKIIESGITRAKHNRPFRHAIGGLKKVKAKYMYTVGGHDYADFIPVEFKTNTTSLLEGQMEKYAEGNDIHVYYNPKDPSENRVEKKGVSFLGFLGFFFTFALYSYCIIGGIYTIYMVLTNSKM